MLVYNCSGKNRVLSMICTFCLWSLHVINIE